MIYNDLHWKLEMLIQQNRHIVVLSGAGMSTESGIPDFRSKDGLWQNETLLETMSEDFLLADPNAFWIEYRKIFLTTQFTEAMANTGHYALTQLHSHGRQVTVFTQNVDGLHQAAGNRRVYEMHGNLRYATCPKCHQRYDLQYILKQEIPKCSGMDMKGNLCDTILHPDIVLFGQQIRYYTQAVLTIRECDLLLVLGTSLTVDPVADLPRMLNRDRTKLVIINLEPTYMDDKADLVIHEKIGIVLGEVCGGFF